MDCRKSAISSSSRQGYMSKSHYLAPTSERNNGGTLGCLGSWEGRGLQSTLIEQVLFLLVCIFQFHVITVSFISFLWLSFFSFAYIVNICMLFFFPKNLQPSLYFTKAFTEETAILTEVPAWGLGEGNASFQSMCYYSCDPCVSITSHLPLKLNMRQTEPYRSGISVGNEGRQKASYFGFLFSLKIKSLSQNNW